MRTAGAGDGGGACWGPSRARRRLLGIVVAVAVLAGACARARPEDGSAVSEADARAALEELRSIAAARTPAAMAQVCERSLDDCAGLSGAIRSHPEAAPGPDVAAPTVLCSRDAGRGAWMLVIEGFDGHGRPYVSQAVFARDEDDRVVALREPAFWLGVAYAGTKVTGSTGWSTAYHPQQGLTPQKVADEMLHRARRSCSSA